MYRLVTLILSLYLWSLSLQGQSYTSYITGSTVDKVVPHKSGFVLSGGGSDNDDAMRWMLDRAQGGDVLVLRASGSDGYNEYFYQELGINVNGVETIVCNSRNASYETYVIEKINAAELIFIAGGDQSVYFDYWNDSPIEAALQTAIIDKKICIGGTSAGMVILGDIIYSPEYGSATSESALANPYYTNVDSLQANKFVQIGLLENTILDSHFDNRDRSGRLVTFLARIQNDNSIQATAIACNEVTSICIDDLGIATVYGEYPEYDDYAYLIKVSCEEYILPETIEENTPLTWNHNQEALSVIKVPGTINGANKIDMTDRSPTPESQYIEELWSVNAGNLIIKDGVTDCLPSPTIDNRLTSISLYPNPAHTHIRAIDIVDQDYQIINTLGATILQGQMKSDNIIALDNIANGVYWLKTKNTLTRFVKI